MKLFLIFLITSVLGASEVVELRVKGKSTQTFVKDSDSSKRSVSRNSEVVYYKNGVKDEKSKFVASRELFISFGKNSKVDYNSFAKKHNLEYMREINSLYKTALFRDLSSKDIIEVSNTFNALKDVRLAQPNFKRYRELR